MRIDLIAGARPNLMKIAPLYRALAGRPQVSVRFVHTGQHYDPALSDDIREDLGLRRPDVFLDVRSGSHAQQTARVMERYEPYCMGGEVDLAIVVGDVNSTLAAALAAKKCGLPVAHLEAGLRSGDPSMPEEINRLATDAISDILWTPSEDADLNLAREGHPSGRVTRVGNIMIDAYEMLAGSIAQADMPARLGLQPRGYAVVTLHRPSNVDDPLRLSALLQRLLACARQIPLVFPVHPRTRARLDADGLAERIEQRDVVILDALRYVDFMSLVTGARLVLTDSGGVQEETSYLGIPCITVRPNTERPVTLTSGTNVLADLHDVERLVADRLSSPPAPRPSIPLWDGATAGRVVADIEARFALRDA